MDFIHEMLDRDPKAREAYDREERVHKVYAQIIQKLVQHRKEKMTQAEVAEKMGVSQPRITCLETMKEPFSLRTLIEYADIVSADISVRAKEDNAVRTPRLKERYLQARKGDNATAPVVKESSAKRQTYRKQSGRQKRAT